MISGVCSYVLEHRQHYIRDSRDKVEAFGHHRTRLSLIRSVAAECWICLSLSQAKPESDWIARAGESSTDDVSVPERRFSDARDFYTFILVGSLNKSVQSSYWTASPKGTSFHRAWYIFT
jgi:hypothetical protein